MADRSFGSVLIYVLLVVDASSDASASPGPATLTSAENRCRITFPCIGIPVSAIVADMAQHSGPLAMQTA